MLDAIIVTVIIAVAAGYLVRRFMKKGASGGCGCGSECGGCNATKDLSAKPKDTGCNCSSQHK